MHRMALLFLAPALGIAHESTLCLDPEFVEVLNRASPGDPATYSTDVPDEFVVSNLPDHLVPLGSRSRKSRTTVVYRTNADGHDVLAEIGNLLTAAGWDDVSRFQAAYPGGFASGRRNIAEYCRTADHTNLRLTAREGADRTLVSIEQYEWMRMHRCQDAYMDRRRELRSQLPDLVPPDDSVASNIQVVSLGHNISSSVDVRAGGDREALLGLFEDQLREQGWVRRTNWASDWSSGSVWTREAVEEGLLVGHLQLHGVGDDPVRARFSLDHADARMHFEQGTSAQMSDVCR